MALRRLILALLLAFGAVLLAVPAPLQAQASAPAEQVAPDYAAWEALALRAEDALEDYRTPTALLEALRGQIVERRTRFLEAQNANRTRIETLRSQITALGPVPEEGTSEASEIAERRAALNDQLARLQAPGIAAEEAFRRADGLVREIDRVIRERQADALLQLWPAPANPANWPAAVSALISSGLTLSGETLTALANPEPREELRGNLPLILGLLLFAAVVLVKGRGWMEMLTIRLQDNATSTRGQQIWALVVSTGQVALPLLGVYALAQALQISGMLGFTGRAMVDALPMAGFAFLSARWLAGHTFPPLDRAYAPLDLPATARREGRFLGGLMGLVLGLGGLRDALINPAVQSDAANAVLMLPFIVIAGVLLFRMGRLLLRHGRSTQEDELPGFFDRVVSVLGRVVMGIGLLAPLLAAVGYVSAAEALVFPAIVSLGLVALLLVLLRLESEIYAMLTRAGDDQRDALVPALIGFALVVLSVPVFALIWGVRDAEMLELWQSFREGFSLGETRIRPMDFMVFVLVFAVGYTVTRVVQGALGTSVLPKTKIDRGGQKAIVSGVGYLGIFIAALFAFSTAGIDLSGLAIVAGALSVGIGFGLQNIVSNFISGIILLIERPISEGDWIEVGGTMGTVRSISVRSTVIETFDRTDVIVPNADLISGSVTNWTRFNMTGRLIVKVGVAYGTDTRKVERILQEVAEAQPLAVLNPPPSVLFRGFGADSLDFEIRVILRDVGFIMRVHSDINHEIARRFAEEGVEIPFAQRDIWLRNPEVLHPPGALPPQQAPAAPVQPAEPTPAPPEPGELAHETEMPVTPDDMSPEDND